MCKYCDLDKIADIKNAIIENDKENQVRVGWTEVRLSEKGQTIYEQLKKELLERAVPTANGDNRLFMDGTWWNEFWGIWESSKGISSFHYCPMCGRKL